MSEKLLERKNAFRYMAPSMDVQAVMHSVRSTFQDMAEVLDANVNECREKSLAFTALEECAMWYMKALSHTDPGGSQVSP